MRRTQMNRSNETNNPIEDMQKCLACLAILVGGGGIGLCHKISFAKLNSMNLNEDLREPLHHK
jgi:hypothetical protein